MSFRPKINHGLLLYLLQISCYTYYSWARINPIQPNNKSCLMIFALLFHGPAAEKYMDSARLTAFKFARSCTNTNLLD